MTHVQKETAVLLKEKGINVPTDYVYAYSEGDMTISAPTLYEAADWIRAKGVHVAIVPTFRKATWDFQYFIYNNETKCWDLGQIGNYSCDTHDLALESGIVHALKHYVK